MKKIVVIHWNNGNTSGITDVGEIDISDVTLSLVRSGGMMGLSFERHPWGGDGRIQNSGISKIEVR